MNARSLLAVVAVASFLPACGGEKPSAQVRAGEKSSIPTKGSSSVENGVYTDEYILCPGIKGIASSAVAVVRGQVLDVPSRRVLLVPGGELSDDNSAATTVSFLPTQVLDVPNTPERKAALTTSGNSPVAAEELQENVVLQVAASPENVFYPENLIRRDGKNQDRIWLMRSTDFSDEATKHLLYPEASYRVVDNKIVFSTGQCAPLYKGIAETLNLFAVARGEGPSELLLKLIAEQGLPEDQQVLLQEIEGFQGRGNKTVAQVAEEATARFDKNPSTRSLDYAPPSRRDQVVFVPIVLTAPIFTVAMSSSGGLSNPSCIEGVDGQKACLMSVWRSAMNVKISARVGSVSSTQGEASERQVDGTIDLSGVDPKFGVRIALDASGAVQATALAAGELEVASGMTRTQIDDILSRLAGGEEMSPALLLPKK